MSGSSDEEISNGNRDGYQRGGSDGDDDEDEEEDRKKKKKNRSRVDFGFGKRLVLGQFTKARNQIRRVKSRKPLVSSSSSSRNVNVTSRGKVVIIHGDDITATRNGFGCKFCFSRPIVLENPDGSPSSSSSSSDPNHPKFTHSMLKSLIEKNDFCSKECNPHIESLID